jgi:RNA polymerase sigma-70 factor (ECF subfamily)
MNADVLRRELIELLPRLRRFAHALTGARHDADDLVQATVERLLGKGVPADAALDKWAFRVCRNAWVDEIRSRRTRSAVSLDDAPEVEEAVDGERVVIGKMTLAEVARALDALPEEQRAALALVVLEGCSYAETAEALDIPIGTVMSRIARARAALAVAMRGDPVQAVGAR